MAADAHRIAPVPCDEKRFFVFLAKALKKNTVCPVVRKSSTKFCTFDFYLISLLQYSASNPLRTEFHFSALHHGDYVLWAELWCVVCVAALIEGAPKLFRKLL